MNMQEEILQKLNIDKDKLVGIWQAEEVDEYWKEKGFVILTKEEFIFVYANNLSKPKVRVKLEQLKGAKKIPLLGDIVISWKSEGGGFLKKILGGGRLTLKISESKNFLNQLKNLKNSS